MTRRRGMGWGASRHRRRRLIIGDRRLETGRQIQILPQSRMHGRVLRIASRHVAAARLRGEAVARETRDRSGHRFDTQIEGARRRDVGRDGSDRRQDHAKNASRGRGMSTGI